MHSYANVAHCGGLWPHLLSIQVDPLSPTGIELQTMFDPLAIEPVVQYENEQCVEACSLEKPRQGIADVRFVGLPKLAARFLNPPFALG